ncbi:hypothetical protein NQ318_000432 [Aromia moschata]|uniref:Transposase n=1 Tax=Aromia moschata TaxID=1265417 RepID=A0AAV8YU13_9CUCU|nr:hypothetical protein NQ318_000432 [Aromia moschata]
MCKIRRRGREGGVGWATSWSLTKAQPGPGRQNHRYDVVIKQERRSRYAKYPDRRISQSTVSRIENKFREFGNVTGIPKSGRKRILDDEQKLDILLDIQDNPHKSTRQVSADNDVSKTFILRLLKNEKYRPHKIHLSCTLPLFVYELLTYQKSRRETSFLWTELRMQQPRHLPKNLIRFVGKKLIGTKGPTDRGERIKT